jgi:hypothetical protein
MAVTSVPSALVSAVAERRAVLFAGAGISVDAIRASAGDLREALARDIQKDFPGYDPSWRRFEDVADEYAAINDRSALVNRIAKLIPQNVEPLESHLASVKPFRFIVTTNWDLLFERAYEKVGQGKQVLSSEEDAPNFNFDQHNLLKIHGTVDRPLTIVATTDDYESYPDTHPNLLDRVGELLWNNTVLFVGHSLRDEHVRRLLSHIRRQRGEWARKAYAVGYFDDVRARLLATRKIEVINVSAEEFLPELIRRANATVDE